MQELLKNERVRNLLREAESAKRLFHDLQAKNADTIEIRGVLDGLYRDIGRDVYAAWRDLIEGRVALSDDTLSILHASPETESFVIGGDPTEDAPLPSTPDVSEESWYTDEEELPTGRLFNPGETRDRLPGDITGPIEIPNPEWIAELGRSGAGRVVAARQPTDDLDPAFAGDPVSSQHVDPAPDLADADVADADVADWLVATRQILADLGTPSTEAPADDEGLRLDAASVALDTIAMPQSVRTALAGQIAARARQLAIIDPNDPAPGWVLKRLRRQRRASGGPPVYGILPDRAPETGSWAEDAHRWWALLAHDAPPDA